MGTGRVLEDFAWGSWMRSPAAAVCPHRDRGKIPTSVIRSNGPGGDPAAEADRPYRFRGVPARCQAELVAPDIDG